MNLSRLWLLLSFLGLWLISLRVVGILLTLNANEFISSEIRKAEAEAEELYGPITETFYTKNIGPTAPNPGRGPLYKIVSFVHKRRHLFLND